MEPAPAGRIARARQFKGAENETKHRPAIEDILAEVTGKEWLEKCENLLEQRLVEADACIEGGNGFGRPRMTVAGSPGISRVSASRSTTEPATASNAVASLKVRWT